MKNSRLLTRFVHEQNWVSRKTQLQPLPPHAHNFISL